MKCRTLLLTTLIMGCVFSTVLYTKAKHSIINERIINQTINTKETPAMIKQLIKQMKDQLEIDQENFPSLIKELETTIKKSSDQATVAVLHSMLAEMYNQYYQQNRWQIDMRTAIVGYTPEDIKEWTSNIYKEKIADEIGASLHPVEVLQQTPTLKFKDIIEEGKDSQILYPTLFDFLVNRALEIQPSEELYEKLLLFRRSQSDKKALMLIELRYLQYKSGKDYSEKGRIAYEATIDSLLSEYEQYDYSVEIIAEKLRLLQNKSYEKETSDSIRTLEYKLCKETIARFPRYERIGILSNWLQGMDESRINVEINNTIYPGDSLQIKIKANNVGKIMVSLYKSTKRVTETLSHYYIPEENKNNAGDLIKESFFSLQLKNTYTEHDTTFFIPIDNKYGLYECVVTVPETDIKTTNVFSVTGLAAMLRYTKTGSAEVLVTDYSTGKPVIDANVNYYGGKRNVIECLDVVKTDKYGLALLPNQDDIYAYQVSTQEDKYSLLTQFYNQRGWNNEVNSKQQVSLFTDRSIYRPGQTIVFKGIATMADGEQTRVVPNKAFKVMLRDANYREIVTKEYISNSYGSFSGEFTLPKNLLNGSFTLSTEGGTTNVWVEEYKRPSFSIQIQPIKGEVSFGDKLNIKGEAHTFSGVSLTQGEVSYRIIRHPYFFRSYIVGGYEEQVAEGKVELNNGIFIIPFSPTKNEQEHSLINYHRYIVVATITDSRGETQEGQMIFAVGDRSFILSSTLKDKVNKDEDELRVSAVSLNGDAIQTKGTYTLLTLKDDIENKDAYVIGKELLHGTFDTEKSSAKGLFSKLPSGRYRLQLKAKDIKGREVEESQDIILYSKDDKQPPVFMHTLLIADKTTCLPGETFEVLFGTSDKNAYVLYEVFNNGTSVLRNTIKLSNENKKFSIPFLNDYKESVTVSFTFVKDGELYNESVVVTRKAPDRTLTIKPETFRNYLLPGDAEHWKFKVIGSDSLPISAEVLAGMYDASLDVISRLVWRFYPMLQPSIYHNVFQKSIGFSSSSSLGFKPANSITVSEYQFNRLDWQGVMESLYYGGRYTRSGGGIRMKSTAVPPMASADLNGEIVEDQVMVDVIAEEEMEESAVFTYKKQDIQLRTNFNETAFFYPFLQTDKDGCLSINFKVPESNTTWKLQMLAHTVDLKYGMLTEEVISSKPLMVQPNLPRFMRVGDKINIAAQIINRVQKEITGTARLELFDPATDEPIVCLTKSQRAFTLKQDSATTVSWEITVPKNEGVIGCRIIADSNAGSDGEQHFIPVLSNEMLVTKAIPFYMDKQNSMQIQMPGQASTTSRLQNMTLEVTGNPVWYAVQALPTLDLPENDNIISWFASYYANTLARSIVETHPRLKTIISQWMQEGGTATTLLSNLEKNEELKNVLLQETPWVMEAKNETEQKQRLTLLFDMNRASLQRDLALQILAKKQDVSGGWGWFDGFYPSRSMTLFVLRGMSQLIEMNAIQYEQQEKEMQIKALEYLDASILKDYEQISKSKTNNLIPSSEQIDYLFVRSGYRDIPEKKEVREANRFYTAQAEKNWEKLSLYDKAKIAFLLHRNGTKNTTKEIVAWLRKTATVSAEKGMYWANNRRGNDYFTSPIETHAFLMSLFKSLGAEKTEIDLQKQWLLTNKRTQQWESVPATVNAIYAILMTGSDWLSERNNYAVTWGNKTLANSKDNSSALGYVKKTIKADGQPVDNSSMLITKEGNSPLWGAVYNQYFEPINSIKQQKGALNIDEKLFIETNSGSQRQIIPLTNERGLLIGDKVIVRLTIRADRAFDYVNVKDLRAGCFEPAEQLSGVAYREGLVYYRSPKDISENFYIAHLPVGTYVFEYPAYVSRVGSYSQGVATIQCMYAPEFISNTAGAELTVKE